MKVMLYPFQDLDVASGSLTVSEHVSLDPDRQHKRILDAVKRLHGETT